MLFCLFAEDTGIFDPDTFKVLVEDSREDGSTLGGELARFFDVLNTPEDQRAKSLPDVLRSLPYVNGQLFAESLGFADFNGDMRNALLAACKFQWSRISPAVFGSLFQSIMADNAGRRRRRQIGAHYTSERDIMKVVRSLFLDDLQAEFEKVRDNRSKLIAFHEKLSQLKFLDPACGCGNFLVVTYRELRRLEHQVIDVLFGDRGLLDLSANVLLNVDQMHGIEIEEWPARIAEVAMWLVDHQMNQEASQRFGKPLLRLPLKRSARIENANALRVDWNNVVPASACSYVLGNPPFVGQTFQTAEQKVDQSQVLRDITSRGALDFVTNWYVKAAGYIKGELTRCGFVSTNSICQGEQAGILWPELFKRFGIKIQFAHRTFDWQSEARGRAHVHVVIVGFQDGEVEKPKYLYDSDADPDEPAIIVVKNISPYLVSGDDVALANRSAPLSAVPKMSWGNKPTDGGHLILSTEERELLLAGAPAASHYIRRYMGAKDFLNNDVRYCLWLAEIQPDELRSWPEIKRRVEAVRDFRLASDASSTRDYADYPTRFRQIAQPSADYLAVPEVSSSRRDYIPIAFVSHDVICSNTVQFVPEATPYLFGILTSTMHMAWVRQVCGRMKSDFRYSNTLVYNNFPWPTEATEKQRQAVERAAADVLAARAAFPGQTLADLYDPLAMPKPLRDAHRALDAAVDKCYRPARFESDRQRVEYLFQLYEKLTSLFAPAKKPPRAKPGGPPGKAQPS